jgi:hypothetical protein
MAGQPAAPQLAISVLAAPPRHAKAKKVAGPTPLKPPKIRTSAYIREKSYIHFRTSFLQLGGCVIAVDWFMPFDHQTLFKRGVVHAKSSSELQGNVLNWAELWLVWAALLLGVTVSMWGMFPDGDFLHGAFALTFNIVAFFTCLFGFGATGLFGVLFVLSSAVSASAFKRFHLVHMGTY